jgi:hypothetical protein
MCETDCDRSSIYHDRSTHTTDPVHRHTDGSWWFWDETWADEHGPYESRQLADDKVREYGKQL